LKPPWPFQPQLGPTNQGEPSNAQPVTVTTPPDHVVDPLYADAQSDQYWL
jgi:hypothetical protein